MMPCAVKQSLEILSKIILLLCLWPALLIGAAQAQTPEGDVSLSKAETIRVVVKLRAPDASAAAALLQQAAPDLLPNEVETLLQKNGLPLDDPLTHRAYPRLDVLAAVSQVIDTQMITISGQVLLQGRSDHSGTQIYLGTGDCSGPPSGVGLVATGPDGVFEINTPVAPQAALCLLAVKQGYLTGQLPDPAGDAGAITLPGGDVTGDGLIDIFDLTYIASRINTNDDSADLIPDGWVDIFDLVIAAGNYNKHGPVSDWQQ